jgi:hypothetical protein
VEKKQHTGTVSYEIIPVMACSKPVGLQVIHAMEHAIMLEKKIKEEAA